MGQNRTATPPNDAVHISGRIAHLRCAILHISGRIEINSIAMQKCNIFHHPTCAEMPLYYMVRYIQSSTAFGCKQRTGKLEESQWTDTAHLLKRLLLQHTDSKPSRPKHRRASRCREHCTNK